MWGILTTMQKSSFLRMRRLPCGDDHPCYFQFPGHDGLQPGESYLVRMLNGPARNIAVTPATPVPLVFTR